MRIRAYLVTLSLSAVAFDIPLIALVILFQPHEAYFRSARFLTLVGLFLLSALVATRLAAHTAFRRAMRDGYAEIETRDGDGILLNADCRASLLVVLHLQFSGIRYRFQ